MPITDNHVDFSEPYTTFGSVKTSEVVNSVDEDIKKTIEIKNKVHICNALKKVIKDGKNELSLGYEAKIHDTRDDKSVDYDFTQSNITPNHLAVVDKGRCGDSCKFTDKNKNGVTKEMKTYQEAKDAFLQIEQLMPTFDAEERKNMMQKMAKAGKAEETDEEKELRLKKEKDMEAEAKKEKDMEVEKKVKDAVEKHISIMSQATDLNCLADDYSFVDKTTNQIMQDCIKTQNDGEFTDSQLPTAFNMLKKIVNPHESFGKGGVTTVIEDKEI